MNDVGDEYLQWALELSDDESAIRAEVLGRLPRSIVDSHAHSSPGSALLGLSPYAWAQPRSSFPSWTAEQSVAVRMFLYGDRHVARRVMAHPYQGFDHKAANSYLLRTRSESDEVILCGLVDDRRYTVDQLASGEYCGLKMYQAYREPPFERVQDYFPVCAMEAAGAACVPVVLHLAQSLDSCVSEVEALAAAHPDVPIVLAHLGRMICDEAQARASFDRVVSSTNVYVDCSMAIHLPVHRAAFEVLGPERVLFGSDEPFNLLRYVAFAHPELGTRLVSPRRYHWIDEDLFLTYRHLARRAVLVHLQVLSLVLDAFEDACGIDAAAALECVFHDNGARLFRRPSASALA